MIRFSLACARRSTNSKAWFRSNDDFDEAEESAASSTCPVCGSDNGGQGADGASRFDRPASQEKMALAVGAEQRAAMAKLKALTEKLRENADYVGDKFAEEARKIHFGETDPRGIYGEATARGGTEPRRGRRRVHADPGVSRRPQLERITSFLDLVLPSKSLFFRNSGRRTVATSLWNCSTLQGPGQVPAAAATPCGFAAWVTARSASTM